MSYLPHLPPLAARCTLSNEEIKRYSRHLIMPEVTIEGQRKLKAASVLSIGTGGLGSPLLSYLAAAGVGRLGVVDFDVVDYSNLQRQIIHGTHTIGMPKVESARERILEINPSVAVETHEIALRSDNAMELFKDYDIIVDGTDNFPTRYLVNDACVLLDKPNVYGSIFRFDGQCTVFWGSRGPCYRCLYPEPPPPGMVPSCAEGGVLGVLPGIIGVLQAIETIKLILGIGESLIGRLLLFDALKLKFKELKLRKNPACPICGQHPSIRELIDYEQFCGMPAVEGALRADEEDPVPEITAKALSERLGRGDRLELLDVRESHEGEICRLPNSRLIPLASLPARLHELDSAHEFAVICRRGDRSASAVRMMQRAGFRKVWNVRGGMLAWSDDVDPTLPKY
jgi:adenylyltransferase/sulfurtransferase